MVNIEEKKYFNDLMSWSRVNPLSQEYSKTGKFKDGWQVVMGVKGDVIAFLQPSFSRKYPKFRGTKAGNVENTPRRHHRHIGHSAPPIPGLLSLYD